VKDFVLTTLTI